MAEATEELERIRGNMTALQGLINSAEKSVTNAMKRADELYALYDKTYAEWLDAPADQKADLQNKYESYLAQSQSYKDQAGVTTDQIIGYRSQMRTYENQYATAKASYESERSAASSKINNTPTNTAPIVKSGSGQVSVNAEAVSAGDFAYGDLGSGTAGGLGNAALLSTTTILPNTQKTQISKDQLNAADTEYTKQMNLLSNYWATGDTSSDAYEEQKQAAMTSQYNWELARNNLEETAVSEKTAQIEIEDDFDTAFAPFATATDTVDLSGTTNDLSSMPADNTEVPTPEIVVTPSKKLDQRVRIRAKTANIDEMYGDESSACFKLRETNGVFFPYTPTISMAYRASYSQMAPTHANTDYWVYTNTPAVQISIQAQFSSQNLDEAQYTLAAMNFFRTATKMHFGETDDNRGLPPPVLLLSGYGDFMFNDISVIITEFSMDMPNNVNYLEVKVGENLAWVPSLTTFNISCTVQQTPKQQREEFNFADFASGKLMADNKGWV